MRRRCVLTLAALVTPLLALGAAAAAEEATVKVSQKEPYGEYLTDGKGRALYMFMADSKGQSTCYDACAKAWPPFTTTGKPQAGPEPEAKKLGTIKRKNDTTQVTYDGWALYYFVKDSKPGDTTGQGVKGFGAEWYLLSPAGTKIETEKRS